MRIQLLSGGLLVAALLQANASPAVAGAWCYLNETEHCGEVSFESCHFGTLGNGGYCYPNPNHRPEARARAESRDVAARSRPSDHFAYVGYRPSTIAWNENEYRNSIQPRHHNRYVDRFQDDWFFGASYGYETKVRVRTAKHHRRHHRRSRYAEASFEMIPTVYDGLTAIALAFHGQADNALEAFAFASPLSSPTDGGSALVAQTALPKGFPSINFARSCRAVAELIPAGAQGADGCTASEMEARHQLARDWNQFTQADRSSCVNSTTMGGGGTYTSLLTCLELKRDVKILQKDALVSAGSRY